MTTNITSESSAANPSQDHHCHHPNKVNASTQKPIDFPWLPIELQYSILILIPPTQIFTLRRVSRSWNSALHNTSLLDQINKQLPFLTSAPDLASRLKRRMRMRNKEPVWVRSFADAFPWVSEFLGCSSSDSDLTASSVPSSDITQPWSMTRFWNGWVVVLKRSFRGQAVLDGPDNKQSGNTNMFQPISKPEMRFKIRSLAVQQKDIDFEIDVLEEFKRINPGAYKECLDGDHHDRGIDTRNGLCLLEFSVKEGLVVGGFQGVIYSEMHVQRRVPTVSYFFIFSILTGKLIQHIHRESPSPTIAEWDFRVSHLTPTHFLTVHTAEYFNNQKDLEYWIDIYSHQDYDGSPELSIIATIPQGSCLYGKYHVDEDQRDSYFLNQLQFDHCARAWIPYIDGTKLVVILGNKFGSNFGKKENQVTFGPDIDHLPISKCGKWSVVPRAAAEELDLWKKLYEYSQKNQDASSSQDEQITRARQKRVIRNLSERYYCQFELFAEHSQGRLCTVDSQYQMLRTRTQPTDGGATIIPISMHMLQNSQHILMLSGPRQPRGTQGPDTLVDLFEIQTYSTHQLSSGGFHGNPNPRRYEVTFSNVNPEDDSDQVGYYTHAVEYSRGSAPWGLVECAWFRHKYANDIKFSVNLHLLPFNEEEPLIWQQWQEAWLSRCMNPRQPMECVWISDGLLGWEHPGENRVNPHILHGKPHDYKARFWAVCYEESWVVPGRQEPFLEDYEEETMPRGYSMISPFFGDP